MTPKINNKSVSIWVMYDDNNNNDNYDNDNDNDK